VIHTTLGCLPSPGIWHEVGEYGLRSFEVGFEGPPRACRLISALVHNKVEIAAFEDGRAQYELTRHGLRRLGLVGQVIDARVLAHTVVERLPLGYNAGRGGAEAMMVPMVDGAIRAESERRAAVVGEVTNCCQASTMVRTMMVMPTPSWSACLRPNTS
jgi:hypothetical protein